MLLLKRIGLTLGSAVLAYFLSFILWYLMSFLARVPILGSIYLGVVWSIDLFFGWLGSWVGLNAPGMLSIMVAIGTAIRTWDESAPPKDWRPNYPDMPPPEPMDGATLSRRIKKSLQEKDEQCKARELQPELSLSDAALPDFLKRQDN